MKIAIVTQPLMSNYGGILQNYALQKVLKNLGHIPVTIDKVPKPDNFLKYYISTLKEFAYKILGIKIDGVFYHSLWKRKENIDSFVRKNISLTKCVYRPTAKLVDSLKTDALIAGSDQVWRRAYNPNIVDSFLGFSKTTDVRRIAYAASFGIDHLEYTEDELKQCRELARRFDAVSVREKNGVRLCKDYLGVDAVQVLDPTLLLTRKDYEFICRDIKRLNGKFLLCYLLDMTNELKDKVNAFAKERNLTVIHIGADNNLRCSIEEWLAYFRDAAYIVTNSFHGTVFSIIFHKRFVTITNEGRGGDRFTSLLNTFGLQDRILNNRFEEKEIDWESVSKAIHNGQEYSISFLKNSLRESKSV